jgi:hypothetical protein
VDLTSVPTVELERFAAACERGRLGFPLSTLALGSHGFERFSDFIDTLNPLGAAGVVSVLRAVLSERQGRTRPELVWTGPEGRGSAARDTAVVLAGLFAQATQRVLLAGFAFDHAESVLRPLHETLARGVAVRVFADDAVASTFLAEHWPFGPPFPEVYGFVPAAGVFASLHAKCVVVDGRWVLATSANFTDRGQSRNVEVGVLNDDVALAEALERQFVAGPWFKRVEPTTSPS